MRLIDADEIPFVNGPKHPHVEGFQTVTKMAIDNAPTVGAIPIEWIRKYIKETPLYQSDDIALYIEDMIADWAEREEK